MIIGGYNEVHTLETLKSVELYNWKTGVNYINVLHKHFFVQNFGAKNYKAVFWVWSFGAKNFVQKMCSYNIDEIEPWFLLQSDRDKAK